MLYKDLIEMKALDDTAEKAGGFVDAFFSKNIHLDYRKLNTYCKEKGIEPIDLTIRELMRFVIPS
ncbi:MAG: hypothetical protein PWQ76_50 [Clostridiales bacterium]|jgi:hypothetical protein|nr:hypothetical protein [Oscillospiraceae bacterium]MDN5377799.1 hypothetical protein [Clostridiales bacterium]